MKTTKSVQIFHCQKIAFQKVEKQQESLFEVEKLSTGYIEGGK